MGLIVLKNEIVDKVSNDPILFGIVAEAIGKSPATLPRLLSKNDVRLTQAGVLIKLREYLGLQDNDILEELQPAV